MSKIKQATKKTGRARKELIVAELVEKIDNSTGLVFTDYKGITHKQLEGLKKELKELNSTIIIAKNSLLKLSLGKSKNYADYKDNEGLNLPTATLFIRGDMVEPLKKVQKTIKEFGRPVIKFAVLEGNLVDEAGVLKIASLPNRETLLAQFVGMLNSPISGLVVTLNGTIQKFVMTLSEVAKAKPAAAAAPANDPTPAQPETPAEEAPTQTPTQTEEAPTVEPAAPAAAEEPTPVEETPTEPTNETENSDQSQNP